MTNVEVKIDDLLESGMHFGHRPSSAHPRMKEFIFGQKQGIHVIDLNKTREYLERALFFIRDIVAQGGVLIFVGTKKQAVKLAEQYAKEAEMPYVNNRWLGGTLTNFQVISSLIKKLKKLKEDRDSGNLDKYTKKEKLNFGQEILRLEELVGGLQGLEKLPQALLIIDVREEKTALNEARRLGIPVVGLVDTNVNPLGVAYPIPGNDDGVRSIEFILKSVKEAIIEGRKKGVEQNAES